MQIKEMAKFIMYVLVEFVFSDAKGSYMYFDLNLNAIIIKLHDEAIYIYSFYHRPLVSSAEGQPMCLPFCFRHREDINGSYLKIKG